MFQAFGAGNQLRETHALQQLENDRWNVDQLQIAAPNSEMRIKAHEHREPRLVHVANLLERKHHLPRARQIANGKPLREVERVRTPEVSVELDEKSIDGFCTRLHN